VLAFGVGELGEIAVGAGFPGCCGDLELLGACSLRRPRRLVSVSGAYAGSPGRGRAKIDRRRTHPAVLGRVGSRVSTRLSAAYDEEASAWFSIERRPSALDSPVQAARIAPLTDTPPGTPKASRAPSSSGRRQHPGKSCATRSRRAQPNAETRAPPRTPRHAAAEATEAPRGPANTVAAWPSRSVTDAARDARQRRRNPSGSRTPAAARGRAGSCCSSTFSGSIEPLRGRAAALRPRLHPLCAERG